MSAEPVEAASSCSRTVWAGGDLTACGLGTLVAGACCPRNTCAGKKGDVEALAGAGGAAAGDGDVDACAALACECADAGWGGEAPRKAPTARTREMAEENSDPRRMRRCMRAACSGDVPLVSRKGASGSWALRSCDAAGAGLLWWGTRAELGAGWARRARATHVGSSGSQAEEGAGASACDNGLLCCGRAAPAACRGGPACRSPALGALGLRCGGEGGAGVAAGTRRARVWEARSTPARSACRACAA